MPKFKLKNIESAQGMLEFALVMPVLLLIILGVFAFGHLFFAYSTVVSASREAARFGAVTGVTADGQIRYRDCPTIRAQAVRIGAFAGVNSSIATGGYTGEDPGVYIGYDHGPRNADGSVSTPYAECPQAGLEPFGPESVELGDRILVRVTVQYQPIVPLIDIPSFPLTATSARTIIKDLAVAVAPTAEAGCIATSISLTSLFEPPGPTTPWDDLWVGQHLIPQINVQAANGTSPTGLVTVTDDTGQTCNFNAPTNIGITPRPCDFSYLTPTSGTPHYITVSYAPDNNGGNCYFPSEAGMWMAVVKAGTITTITGVNPEPSYVGDDVVVNFSVMADTPGSGVPNGSVSVSDGHGRTCGNNNNLNDAGDGIHATGSCTIRKGWPQTGTYELYATYAGNASYNGSTSATVPHIVIEIVPTQIIPPTQIPPLEAGQCPALGGASFSGTNFQVPLTNPNAAGADPRFDFTITQVVLLWPSGGSSSTMLLNNFDFGSNNIWKATGGSPAKLPPSATFTSFSGNSGNLGRGASKNLVFSFSINPLNNPYTVDVQMRNSANQTCTASRQYTP